MVAFGHTAIGALVGLYTYQHLPTSNPVSGLIITGAVGVVSHYIMDCIPHGHFFRGDKNEYKRKVGIVIMTDLLLSVSLYLLTAYYFSQFNLLFTLYILFGIGGSQLPDIVDGLIYIGVIPNKGLVKLENSMHINTHWHGKKGKTLLWSIWDVWQVAIFFIGLYLILTFKQ